MKKNKILSAFLSLSLSMTSFAAVPVTASAAETTTAPTVIQTTTKQTIVTTKPESPPVTTTITTNKQPTLEEVVEFPTEGKFPMKFTVVDEASKEVVKDLDIELYTLDDYSADANFIDKLAEWNTADSETYSCELPYNFENQNSYSAYGVVIKNMPEGYVYSFSGENSKCFPVDYRPITIWTDIVNGNDTHEHEYVILIEKEGTIHNPVTTTKPDPQTNVTTETTAVLPTLEEVVEFPTEGKFPMKFTVVDEASKEVVKDLDIELYTLDNYSADANFIDKLAEWNTTDSETYSCELPYNFENQDSYSAYGVVIKNMPEGYVYSFSGENSKCFPVDYRPVTIWTDIVNGNDTHEHEYVILIEKEGTIHNPVTTTKPDPQTNVTTETTAVLPTLEEVVKFPTEGKYSAKITVVDEASKEVVKDLDIELYTLDNYSADANFIDKLAEWNTTDSETYSCELPYSFENQDSYSAYGVVIKNMPEGYVYSFSGENSKCFPVDYRPVTIWTDIVNGNDTHEQEYVILIEKEGTIHNPVTTSNSNSDITTTTTTAEPVKGDANCDGELSMADAVLIMQSIANPAKFGIEGTDEHHITEQGKKNADIAGENDGVTNADALAIQKKLLKLD